MRIYLSGPMSGLTDHNKTAFHAYARQLRNMGHDVVNPAEIDHGGNDWAGCLREDIPALCTCETIALMPGWEKSRGARLELHIAEQLEMTVIDVDDASEIARRPDSGLSFNQFRVANVARALKWHPQGLASWSASDWMTAVTGELGELASLLKMRNRERDGLPGNKFSPTNKQIADEIADVVTYMDLLAAMLGVDLGDAVTKKFNEVSERVGFPDRL